MEQQFGTLMKDFRRHRKSVEKEAELAHLLEAEKARAVERANIKRQDKQKAGTITDFVLVTFYSLS